MSDLGVAKLLSEAPIRVTNWASFDMLQICIFLPTVSFALAKDEWLAKDIQS